MDDGGTLTGSAGPGSKSLALPPSGLQGSGTLLPSQSQRSPREEFQELSFTGLSPSPGFDLGSSASATSY